jgi:HEAT repeat protein
VRKSAVDIFETLGNLEDIPDIKKMINDDDPEVISTAAEIFKKIASRYKLSDMLAQIKEMLKDDNPKVNEVASDVFKMMINREGFSLENLFFMKESFKDPDPKVRGAAFDAFKELVRQDTIPDIKNDIKEMLNDENPNIRDAAIKILHDIQKRYEKSLKFKTIEQINIHNLAARRIGIGAKNNLEAGELFVIPPFGTRTLKDDELNTIDQLDHEPWDQLNLIQLEFQDKEDGKNNTFHLTTKNKEKLIRKSFDLYQWLKQEIIIVSIFVGVFLILFFSSGIATLLITIGWILTLQPFVEIAVTKDKTGIIGDFF